ncbi:hypothetical protein HK098_004591 [Nowakowskiella sp. JEL0407]|nr:hypothetical protein HK098_004591 [Nowakowskiella sp. JEL0407]
MVKTEMQNQMAAPNRTEEEAAEGAVESKSQCSYSDVSEAGKPVDDSFKELEKIRHAHTQKHLEFEGSRGPTPQENGQRRQLRSPQRSQEDQLVNDYKQSAAGEKAEEFERRASFEAKKIASPKYDAKKLRAFEKNEYAEIFERAKKNVFKIQAKKNRVKRDLQSSEDSINYMDGYGVMKGFGQGYNLGGDFMRKGSSGLSTQCQGEL